MNIYVGCCGFALPMKLYLKEFQTIELQSTFYRLPRIETVKRWRALAPKDFIFCIKAFQGVTHPINSPTWRRSGIKLTGNERFGNLQNTKEVFESWNKTLEVCSILNAKICLIQLPASFKDDLENIKRAEDFFSTIKRNGLKIAIELRGWSRDNIKQLCERFDLIHCTDPFDLKPTYFGTSNIAYLRLHGKPPGKELYKYKYSREDLLWLKDFINKLETNEVFVFFNNIYMKEDSMLFKQVLSLTSSQ